MRNRFLLFALALLLLTGTVCWPQDTRGSILGRITDPSGAVVPGATVVVANPAMGTKATISTNADGMYLAPLLSPGTYQIEVSAAGFKKAVRSDVQVRVADRRMYEMKRSRGPRERDV